MKKTRCFSQGGPDLRHDCLDKTSGNKSASVAGYVADLEAFMVVVSSKLKCLPSFADPHPDEGNEHVIRKLDELLKRAT